MVDYSKWDNIDYGSSDEDEGSAPHVTALSKPESITVGPGGYTVGKVCADQAMPVKEASKQGDQPEVSFTGNGAEIIRGEYRYFWSQDRYTVCLRLIVPEATNNKNVSVSITDRRFEVKLKDSTHPYFVADLQYDVTLTGESDNPYDKIIDWEIVTERVENCEYKMLKATLVKKSPIPGATMWWRRVFVGDPEIDVTKIGGRSAADLASAQNYAEAHRLFQEKISQFNQHKV